MEKPETSDLVLEHYSEAPLSEILSVEQVQSPVRWFWPKPKGLWLSVPGEKDWPEYCADIDSLLDRMAFRSTFRLRPGHNVLMISTGEDIDSFDREFGSEPPEMERARFGIEWHLVAEKYDGIIIAPHQHRQSFELDWYWRWDCASGCIWNPEAIEMIECQPFDISTLIREEVE